MSRWLHSVNALLEQLDGQVESAATLRASVEEEEDDDDSTDDAYFTEEAASEPDEEASAEYVTEEEVEFNEPSSSSSPHAKVDEEEGDSVFSNVQRTDDDPKNVVEEDQTTKPLEMAPPLNAPHAPPPRISIPQPIPATETTTTTVRPVRLPPNNDRVVQSLQAELRAVEKELLEAAGLVQDERAAWHAERQELRQEQAEEIRLLQAEHAAELREVRRDAAAAHERQERQWRQSQQRQSERKETLAEQLQQMEEQVQTARHEISQLQRETEQLQSDLQHCQQQNTVLQQHYDATVERLARAEAAVAAAEERWDETLVQHRQQLQQHRAREAALEHTVAQLSSSSSSQPTAAVVGTTAPKNDASVVAEYQAQCAAAREELETVQTELALSQQRCAILEAEFQDMVQERERDVQKTLQMQQEYEHRILASEKARPAAPDDTVAAQMDHRLQHLTLELRQANEQIQSLSDQCLRQQNTLETTKAEVLAWKGRYQEALARAETAAADRTTELLELGRPSSSEVADALPRHRRRVKGGGGGTRYSSTVSASSSSSHRSMRVALGLFSAHRGRGHFVYDKLQEQLGTTIDALDRGMVETGQILRHEPLARLGLAVYLVTIHLFCFVLVAFHTIEAEHGDLGQLTSQSRGAALFRDHPLDRH